MLIEALFCEWLASTRAYFNLRGNRSTIRSKLKPNTSLATCKFVRGNAVALMLV